MKFEFSALILGFAALSNSVLAADVVQMGLYLNNDCDDDPLFKAPIGLAGKCIKLVGSTSVRYTCSELETFSNANCEGSGTKIPVDFGCLPVSDFSGKLECNAIPDNKIAKIKIGTSCGEDGEVSGSISLESLVIVDTCTSLNLPIVDFSYKLGVTPTSLDITFYPGTKDCSGLSKTFSLESGICKITPPFAELGVRRLQGESQIAIKIEPAVEGADLNPEPTDDDGPGDDQDDQGNGNGAMGDSASFAALIVATIAAFATVA